MLHGTYECEIAQNSACEPEKLYTVREKGHHVTSPRRMRGWKRDLGMYPHKVSADTKNGPKTDTRELAPSPLY